jgi:endonuclease YncB( thermonuclease family)
MVAALSRFGSPVTVGRLTRVLGLCTAGVLTGPTVLSAPGEAPGRPESFEAVITRVVDGDTVWVRRADRGRAAPIKVRLHGLDAPERCQAGGVESQQALAGRLADDRVRVHPLGRDEHGRLLARLTRGDADVGAWMVAQGWAWSEGRGRSGGRYGNEQRAAQAVGRGLHADPAAIRPREFRQRFGPCQGGPGGFRGGPRAVDSAQTVARGAPPSMARHPIEADPTAGEPTCSGRTHPAPVPPCR